MRKWYPVYLVVMLVFCAIGLSVVEHITKSTEAKLAAIRAETQTAEASVEQLERVVEARKAAQVTADAHLAATMQAARIKAALDAEAARINHEIATRPKPAPVTGWAPGGAVSGRVYSNANLVPAPTPPAAPPDVQGPRLVVEMDPVYGTEELRAMAQDARLRCAAFSYQPEPGVTRNRVYCAQTGR